MAIRRNIAANFGSYAVATFMGVAFIPVYVRFLGTEAYGLIGVFSLLQTWLVLLDFGLVPALGREMARSTGGAHTPSSIRSLLRSVETTVLALAVLVMAGAWAVSPWLASHWLHAEALPLEQVATALTLMGVVIGLRLMENVYRSSLLGLQHQVSASSATAGVASGRAVGAVAVIAWISPTVTAFFLWQAAISAVSVLTFAWLLYQSLPRSDVPARPSFGAIGLIWRFAGGSVAITLTGTVLSQLDKVVLSSALTLGSFAVYSVASMVSGAVRLLAQPIDLAVYPRLTQLYQTDDQAGLSELYHRATQYSVVVMGGLAVFLFAFGPEVLQMWTQNIGLSARVSPVLRILVIGMLLNGLMNGPYYLQMAAGWTDLLVRTNVVMVVIFVPVVIASVLMFGLIGAATAWVLINIAYLAVVTRVMHRRLLRGEMLTWYGRDILEPVAGAAVAGLLLRLLMPIQTGLLAGYLTLALIGILAFSGLAAGRVRQDLVDVVHRRFSEAQASDRRM